MTPIPPASPYCGWWIRWWHRRLRTIDRQILFPALRERAKRAALLKHAHGWRVNIEADFNYFAMLDAHANGEGQGHWRCPCYLSESRRSE